MGTVLVTDTSSLPPFIVLQQNGNRLFIYFRSLFTFKGFILNQGFYKTATSEFLDSFQRHCQSEINLKVFFNTSLGIIELIRPQNFLRN